MNKSQVGNCPILGAIIGDMVGSPYEFNPTATDDHLYIDLWQRGSEYTDDTILTLAVFDAVYSRKANFPEQYIEAVEAEPLQAWGGGFRQWAMDRDPTVNRDSLGNGCVMRLSPVPYLLYLSGGTLEEALEWAEASCLGSHMHPISLTAVRAYTEAMYLLLRGESVALAAGALGKYGFPTSSLAMYNAVGYAYSERVDRTLAESFVCFAEAGSFEETMRNVLSLHGDTDTMCAIAGGFSAIVHGIPQDYIDRAANIMMEPRSSFVGSRWDSFCSFMGM